MMNVTRVPRTPGFVRGVINLRGKVIPVFDLRLKFGLEAREDTDRTCIIVVQFQLEGRSVTIGVIVDEVSEVLNVMADQIEPPPAFGSALDVGFLQGMGKVGQKVVMLLDIDKVLSQREIEAARVETAAEAG
jgi:purine-binding chemotaxis protein CheW